MEVYLANDKFILAVCGGEFHSFASEPVAIILKNRPLPLKKWSIPRVIDKDFFIEEECIIDTEFRVSNCDEKKCIYCILNILG